MSGEQVAGGPAGVPQELLRDIERVAVGLARLAGTEIVAALGRTLEVRYKGNAEGMPTTGESLKDPVSEVDSQVEVLIRAKLGDRFPEHDILGEEMDERPGRDHDFVWAVDPIDGTTNFVNGFPLFAGSIGVLHRGRPVVGAVWCSTSHALRPGVYHARTGGPLCFDEEALDPRPNPEVRRRLAGEPEATPDAALEWDIRKTGSAAVECAFVAAGLLRVARFERPNVWDVAGGIPLVLAAGGEVRYRGDGGWVPLERLEPVADASGGAPDLRNWRRPLILGQPDAVERMARMRAG
ncbi:inositol-1-monophosphatase [Skermanella mucosa]|uniref:inositol monophosphatase family protein n=1 Tax=Skermanella mucosa TaxID=1789672 RepID=UPI00192B0BEC|nr:inositol monophosphatase family protein [Skermanella mucosa]UEM19907.1 inositol-1-monophosphatase [Skermanella mucosa]